MNRVAVVVVGLLVVTSGCSALQPPDDPSPETTTALESSYSVTVTAVIDGDTVDIRFANGSTDRVRLLGVDTPETHAENTPDEFEGVPETDAGRTCLREAGKNATRYMTQRLLGETVTFGTDAAADGRGYYGRLLGYLVDDGTNVNYRLVATGHARVYDSEFTQSDRFYAAEERAQANGTGVWACGSPRLVADGGTTDIVASVHADAAGDDRQNLNDEYVVLTSPGERTLDISGWTVGDESGVTYTVPDGTTLPPDKEVRLRTGSGTDTDTDLYWGSGRPVWNNAGDTVTITAANGTVVAEHSYS